MAEEWIIIAGIIVFLAVLFFWRGKRIPDLARQAGRMTKDAQQVYKESQQAYREGFSSSPTRTEEAAGSDLLIETAKRMGVNTEGKTREEISGEMVKKARISP